MASNKEDIRINYYPLVCSSVKQNKVLQRSSHAMGSFNNNTADTDLHLIHGGENSSKTFNTVLVFSAQGIIPFTANLFTSFRPIFYRDGNEKLSLSNSTYSHSIKR